MRHCLQRQAGVKRRWRGHGKPGFGVCPAVGVSCTCLCARAHRRSKDVRRRCDAGRLDALQQLDRAAPLACVAVGRAERGEGVRVRLKAGLAHALDDRLGGLPLTRTAAPAQHRVVRDGVGLVPRAAHLIEHRGRALPLAACDTQADGRGEHARRWRRVYTRALRLPPRLAERERLRCLIARGGVTPPRRRLRSARRQRVLNVVNLGHEVLRLHLREQRRSLHATRVTPARGDGGGVRDGVGRHAAVAQPLQLRKAQLPTAALSSGAHHLATRAEVIISETMEGQIRSPRRAHNR
eukprot:726121-Pleurochrysis_carterae.AAC.1